MTEPIDGVVINLNAYGATVRLENGELASALPDDVDSHRSDYERSLGARRELAFELRREGRRLVVVLAPQIRDDDLDERIATYLKSTQEWDAPDGVPQAERHFLHKKRRAALFQSRHSEVR
ncbi:MAG: hypothetical protein JOY69_10965 [Candidatus Eremiobacteraeota bacterium]|nr:hypothetical protein [Candidatus Eremiobacteraeota bacterium]